MTTLKIGTVLIANEDSFLKSSGKQFLIKGKKYPITVVQKKHIEIKSESHDVHEFTIGQLENYFAIKRYTLTDLKEKKIAVKIRDYKEYKRLCEAVGDEDNGEFLFLKDKYYGFDYHNDGIYILNKGELEGRTLLESIDNIDLKEKEESKTCKYCGLTIQKGTDEEDCPNNPKPIYGFDDIGFGLLYKGELEGRILLKSIDEIALEEKEDERKPINKVAELIGEASMCWSKTPKGVFDSTRASEIVDEIEAVYNSEISRLKEENQQLRESTQISQSQQSERTRMAWELYVSGFNHGIADKWTIDECFRSAEIFLSHAKSKEVKS